MSRPLASVVVPTRQRRDSVQRLLAALSRQTLPPSDFEVIISRNGPADGTAEMVAAFPASFELRSLWQAAQGRAAACNAGVREAVGRRIILLDDDLEPAPHCLAAHLAANPNGSRIGIVGAVPIPNEDSASPLVAYRARGFKRKLEILAAMTDGLPYHMVYTGNFSLPRSLFLEAGGYDDAFRLYGHEDYEFALRLAGVGATFRFSRDALAVQHYDKTLPQLANDILDEGHTALVFARKHPAALPHLELGRADEAPPGQRRLRRAMLRVSRTDRVPAAAVRIVSWLETLRPARLFDIYDLLFDYLYWLGAVRASCGGGDAWTPDALEGEVRQLRPHRPMPGEASADQTAPSATRPFDSSS